MKLSKKPAEDLIESSLEQSKVDKAKQASSKPMGTILIGTMIGAVLGLCIAVAICFFIYQGQVENERQKQLAAETQQRAKLSAERIHRHLRVEIEKVDFFSSQTPLRQAILASDESAVDEAISLVHRQLRNVVSVSAFAIDQVELNEEVFPPIRFSELALIKAAESGELPQPEMVQVDGQWLLHYVRPVVDIENPENVDGVLWITTDTKALKAIIETENQGLGQVSLFQNFGPRSRPLVLQSVGSGSETSHVSRVKGTNWEVEFAAGPGMNTLTHINIGFVYLFMASATLVCIVLSTGLGFFFGRMRVEVSERHRLANAMQSHPSKVGATGDLQPQSHGLLEVDIVDEDASLLGLDDEETEDASFGVDEEESLSLDDDVFDIVEGLDTDSAYPSEIFRAYDIRGLAYVQITKEFALQLGKALGSELLESRETTIAVARDARKHSPELTEYLIRGILSTGCNVLNFGTVPTPLMYFGLETMDEVSSGVMVTASHNGADHNGFKTVLNGVSRSADDIQNLRVRMIKAEFISGQGQELRHDIVPSYIDTIFSDVALAGEMYVVVDAGNAVGGKVAPKLLEELGCRVEPLYCDLDGGFPNHDPDPSKEENLQDLIEKVKELGADIGIALDGDGDRLTAVSPSGKVFPADRLLMLFAKDIVSRSPGADVVFDVKSTRHLNACVASYGGRPIMWKTGHSFMRSKMQETGAVVGAEYSGHIFIRDRWFGFDDGMYAAARLLEVLSLQGENLDEAFEEFPESLVSPEYRIAVDETKKFELIESVKKDADFQDGRLTLIDGVRVDFAYGWGLVRASNTAAELTLRFEADDEDSMHKLKSLFVKELRAIDGSIDVDWNQ